MRVPVRYSGECPTKRRNLVRDTPSQTQTGRAPAKQALNWTLDVTKEDGYKPGEVVTYYCRIHPFMRGAFEVGK